MSWTMSACLAFGATGAAAIVASAVESIVSLFRREDRG